MQTDPQAYERALAVAQNRMSAVTAAQQFSGRMGEYARGYGGQLARYGAQGPGVNVGGQAGALAQSTRMEALTQAAANAGKTLDQFVNDEQEMAKFNKGELARQVDTRRAQLNIAQSLDSTVESFSALNAISSTLTKGFEKLSRALPGAAGGPATTGSDIGDLLRGIFGASGTATTGGSGRGPGSPGGPGISVTPGAGTPRPAGATAGAVDYSGLKIKSNESTAGGEAKPQLVELARNIQNQLGGNLKYFSAFNDLSHDKNSAHTAGRALDFVLNDQTSYPSVASFVRNMAGVKTVLDEATYPRATTTGPHIHAEISARDGYEGILSGPSGGYRPNLEMHNAEKIKISPISSTSDRAAATEGSMASLIDEMKELVSISKSQLYVNEKILRYQQ
jgi:hypothetical protein